jgi:hypothetical protein
VNSEPEGEEDGGGSEDEAEEDEEEEEEDEEEEDEEEEDEEEEEEDDAGEGNDAREQDAGKDDAGEENAGKKDVGDEDAGENNAAEDGTAEDNAVEGDVGEDNDAEHGAAEDCSAEEDAGEDDAGKDVVGDLDNSEEGQDLEEEPQRDAVMNKENGHDVGEQEGDGDNEASNVTANEAASDMEDKGYEDEEDLAENTGIEGEREAEGRPEAEEQQEAGRKGEREGEREGKEVTGEEMEPSGEARGKDCGVHGGEEEEHGGDWEAGTKQGDQDRCGRFEGSMGQRVTANDRDGPWRSWKTGDTRGEEDEERCTNATGQEDTVEDGNARTEKRKRSSTESTSEERLNKRHQSARDRNGVDTTTADSLDGTIGLKAQLRPQTPPLKSTTPSAPPTIEIVRQASVVSRLKDTESAVWDAARRDPIFCSLDSKDQRKLVCTAVSLGSDKGIEELQRFVYNARRDGKQKGKSLASEFDLSVTQSDGVVRTADGTFNSSDSGLDHFYALYQQIETLDKVAIKLFVTRRVKLATMAQHRNALVQNGASRNQAKYANLRLFRAIHPEYATIERPDKAENSVIRSDWKRLSDRLAEGKRWLDIRDRFGGAGVFLVLPPQCVSDRYVQKMTIEKFNSWLRLLDVVWRALDEHARLTLNELVRMSLTGQPLPEVSLPLEMLEDGTDKALTSLSGMFTGWHPSDRNFRDNGTKSIVIAAQREESSDAAAFMFPAATLASPRRAEAAEDIGSISQQEMMENAEDGLFDGFDDVDFD